MKLIEPSLPENMHNNYYHYLRKRRLTGLLYRKFWLYPRFEKVLHGRILDVGCGIGDFLSYYSGATGVDINPHSVSWCLNRGLDARMMERDKLPFEIGSFDCVVLDNVLEHLEDPSKLLQEIYRVLDVKGQLLVGVPCELGYSNDLDHKVFYDEESLNQLMLKYGFNKIRLFYMPFKFHWLATRIPQYCLYGVYSRDLLSNPYA